MTFPLKKRTAKEKASPPERVQLNRAYKFRLYPTPAQDAELSEWCRQLRFLWNLAHEQRLASLNRLRGEQPRVDYFKQAREMTELVRNDVQLERVLCSARQEVLRDLDKAWQRWRKKLGGKPHFKRRTDHVRFYLSTPKHWKVLPGFGLILSGAASVVGDIKMRQDRPFPKGATFSSCHLVKDVDQWFAVFPLKFDTDVKPAPARSVGINRGVVHAVADSDGRVVDSPAFYKKALSRIALLSRRLDKKESGSKNRFKAAQKLAKAHRKVRRQREFWLHQQSAHYSKNYSLIGIEDWSTKEMTRAGKNVDEKDEEKEIVPKNKKHLLNRGILDVGWYELGRQIAYKVETTSSRLVAVPPGRVDSLEGEELGISRTCSLCGADFSKSVSGRKDANCSECENRELGDINAAINVRLRAELVEPPTEPKKKTVSIKIKGRQKRSVTPENPSGEVCGGEASVGAPVEAEKNVRENIHPERTVLPKTEIDPTLESGFS